MLLPVIILTLLALLVWVLAELTAKLALRIGVCLVLFACIAYTGFLGGKFYADIESSWVPKEHVILAGAMKRMEHLAETGNTNALLRALSAYNQKARARTNEFGFYEAAIDLHEKAAEGN